MNEWLVIDKVGDYFYYKDIKEVSTALDLTKSQVYNLVLQSIKHYNKYTSKGVYIQRLYNDPSRPPRHNFIMDKYIYYVDDDGEKLWGQLYENKI
tara:strand:- start:7311 stop:7595 length:285 start_codon:yes stop_codon:yes gene_type:complete